MKLFCWHKWKVLPWYVVYFISSVYIKKEWQELKICVKCGKEILPDFIENYDNYMFVDLNRMDGLILKLSEKDKELYKEALAFGESYKP